MRVRGQKRPRLWWCVAAILTIVLGGGCSSGDTGVVPSAGESEGSGTSTTETTAAVPPLSDHEVLELRARAPAQGVDQPEQICIHSGTDPALRAALEERFDEVILTTPNESGMGWDPPCTKVGVGPAVFLRSDVIGIEVWSGSTALMGHGKTVLFRWDGTAWIDANPDEVGVTVTTSVS